MGTALKQFLIRVVNAMLNAVIENRSNVNLSLMIMNHLSAPFDTIDHTILHELLQTSYGVGGISLKWIKSYLPDRKQKKKENRP